jgi:hypothetical protein
MMDHNNDGGAAFARAASPVNTSDYANAGMSLRDYFAAQVVTGMAAGSSWPRDPDAPWMARIAYKAADAMLAERAK